MYRGGGGGGGEEEEGEGGRREETEARKSGIGINCTSLHAWTASTIIAVSKAEQIS